MSNHLSRLLEQPVITIDVLNFVEVYMCRYVCGATFPDVILESAQTIQRVVFYTIWCCFVICIDPK